MKDALIALLKVKSIVTIILTSVFAYLAIVRVISNEQFLTIFATVITFYFTAQTEKKKAAEDTSSPIEYINTIEYKTDEEGGVSRD